MKLTILAVHGVGNPQPDSVAASLRKNLQGAGLSDLPITEYNWNQFVAHPLGESALHPWSVGSIAHAIIGSAGLNISHAVPGEPRAAGWVRHAQAICFYIARVGVALAAGMLLLSPLVSVLVLVPSWFFELAEFSMGWYPQFIVYDFVVILAALAALLILGLLRASMVRSWANVRTSIRTVLLLVTSPFVIVLLLPFLISWRRLARPATAAVTAAVAVASVAATALYFLGYGQEVAPYYTMTAFVNVTVLLMWTLAAATREAVAPFLKILLDIFRYLGSPSYRRTIQKEFDRAVAGLPRLDGEGCKVLMLAHSLGSVIALDSLLNSKMWRSNDSVVLVTGGSPLRRFFFRFFPNVLFPDSPRRVFHLVRGRLGDFQWVNVYRPWDPIGTSLRLNTDSAGYDFNTLQWTRGLSAHVDYWSDPVVLGLVQQAYGRLNAQPAPVDTPMFPYCPDPDPDTFRPGRGKNWLSMDKVVQASRVIIMLIWLTVFAVTKFGLDGEQARILDDLDARGARANAEVSHKRLMISPPTDKSRGVYEDIFEFRFQSPDGVMRNATRRIKNTDWFSGHKMLFDPDDLRDLVRARGTLDRKPRWFESEIFIRCTADAVPIIYDTTDPEQLYVPDCRPRWGVTVVMRGLLHGAALSMFAILFLSVIFGFVSAPIVWVSGQCFALFYGAMLVDPSRLDSSRGRGNRRCRFRLIARFARRLLRRNIDRL